MKLKTWVPLGPLILLLCAQQGQPTLILGSMLMAATAAMTGGLIMGPLTIGGLIMMMMMAANQQQATQRTQSSSTTPVSSTLENSQNLLNLLTALTGAASNLATSASTQSNAFANAIQSTTAPKASKRALYSPQNLEELLAASSRRTSNRRQWKSLPKPRATTPPPRPRSNAFFDSEQNEFFNGKSTYFSPDSGYAVEPIPDDLLDIAMRLPQAKSENMFGDFDSYELTSTGAPSSSSSTSTFAPADDAEMSSTTPFSSFMSDLSPPKPIEDMRWVDSGPGDLFSSFPQVTEEDLLNLVRKRATRQTLSSKFRLEDIANVTYANDKDPKIKEELSEREKQEVVNSRIYRQLSALDPLRCLPQLVCNLQATPPSQQSGLMNDYAYLLKSVFERDEEAADDEEEDKNAGSKTVQKNANSKKKNSAQANLMAELSTILGASSGSKVGGSRNKNKKVLDYKSPSKPDGKSKSKKDSGDKPESDKNDEDEEEDDDDDGYSSEEIPMNDEQLERLMLKEQYEMEQLANEELLNEDPELLPYVLKSASKAPSYLGPDHRPYQAAGPSALAVLDDGVGASGGLGASGLGATGSPYLGGGRVPGLGREDDATGPSLYGKPSPLFSTSKLARYKAEDLDRMSSSELNNILRHVSYPGEDLRMDDETFGDGNKANLGNILSNLMPKMPELSFGFSARRKTTGNVAFDEDPFFDDFRRRSLEPFALQKLKKVRRVVRKVRMAGPPGKLAYVRRIKRQITSETDPAEIFKLAKEAGTKFKSARQCRFLFNSCPMNSSQLLSMIGNIRNAVINLSSAQQLLTQTTTQAPAKDIVQPLATLGPNVVTFPPEPQRPRTTPAPPPPMPQYQHHPQGIHVQPVFPLTPMMPHSPSSSNQNTLVVPQIIQVPMPIQTSQPSAPAPQPIIVQQPAPQMIMAQQQRDPPQQQFMGNRHMNPIFNVGSNPASTNPDGLTSISHELPTGEKLEISMKLSGQATSPSSSNPTILKTKKKTAYPSESPRPPTILPEVGSVATKSKNTAADLVDLFDDDNADNFLLPTKALIETEIKEPSTSIDSLQAAILAIEKINQAANERKKVSPFVDDDEREDYNMNQKLISSIHKPIVARPITRKPGLRLPSRKKNKDKKKQQEQPSDDEGDDESSEEEEDDEEEDEDGYKRRLPDPMDPKRRDFVPVPTKSAQFSSTLSVPATQTFVKKRLQLETVQPTPESSSEETLSNREMLLSKRMGPSGSSSEEEDDDEPNHNRRQFTISTTSRSRVRARKPKILYPQEDLEKPVFIPL